MEGHEGSGLDGALMKRRRSSSAARRPRPEGGPAAAEQRENTSPSSSSRSGSRRSPSEDGGLRRREFHLNDPSPEPAAEGGLRSSSKAKGSLYSTGDKSMKVTLKIRKPNPDASDSRPPRPGDSRLRQKHDDQGEGGKDSGRSTSLQDKKVRKEKSIETLAREHPANVHRELSSDPVRKSRRLAKKPILDSELHEDYDTTNVENLGTSEDMEDHILEPKSEGGRSSKKKALKKAKSKSKVYEISNDFGASRSNKDGKKRSRESFDGDDSEEEPTSDSELDAENKKEESPGNVRSGALTTRRRALQSWMDGSSNSTIEFPDGLPPAPSRGGKKEKLSEEEMLAKKAEAAQRRKMQVEKATKESEAEAIRKILGLDSDKKKEERKQKEREEKERAARAQDLAASTIRWVMGPTGTTVSFPHAVGLPSIFNSKPHSYPPPREKCAGPSCTNAYRYRDSKLNLPLCSLKCYKAVNGNA